MLWLKDVLLRAIDAKSELLVFQFHIDAIRRETGERAPFETKIYSFFFTKTITKYHSCVGDWILRQETQNDRANVMLNGSAARL